MRKKIGILHSKKKTLQKLALKSEHVFLIVLFVLVVYIDLNKKNRRYFKRNFKHPFYTGNKQ